MNLFTRLPGFERSAPGLEQRVWRRLPSILLWSTLLPAVVAVAHRVLAPPDAQSGGDDRANLLWDYAMLGLVMVNWTLVLTVGLGCFIVRVMKGPAYVADAYLLPKPVDAAPNEPITMP